VKVCNLSNLIVSVVQTGLIGSCSASKVSGSKLLPNRNLAKPLTTRVCRYYPDRRAENFRVAWSANAPELFSKLVWKRLALHLATIDLW